MTTDDTTGDLTGGAGPDVRDLIGAYALDAVDDVERRAVERLVARDPGAARELAELRATAALLGSASAARPPAGLRAEVLDQIRGVAQSGPAGPATPTSRAASAGSREPAARRPRRTTTWLAIAATALGAAVVPTALALQQARQAEQAEQSAQAIADLLADPGATVVRAEVAGGGTAVGVIADDRALFTATGLTEPGDGREYQLWLLRDGEALPRAVMPDDDGRVRALADGYRSGDALAVTVEPAGGSEQPTTTPVVVLEATAA